jgi:hypothetical protein
MFSRDINIYSFVINFDILNYCRPNIFLIFMKLTVSNTYYLISIFSFIEFQQDEDIT